MRLCSTSCRELAGPETPARTLGLAAASTTKSTAGNASMSLISRTSPCVSLTPSRPSSRRFNSLPGRPEVIQSEEVCLAPDADHAWASVEPTNPQAPVIRILMSAACYGFQATTRNCLPNHRQSQGILR